MEKMLIIKEYSIIIKLDEDNKLLFAYDFKNGIIKEESEGILIEVNDFIYENIKSGFNINPESYGVTLCKL